MKESYQVCHCGKEKSFSDIKQALAHAEVLNKLGYEVKVYRVTEGLFILQKILIYMSPGTQEAEVLRKLRGVSNGIIKG